jgi:hypothetical protein
LHAFAHPHYTMLEALGEMGDIGNGLCHLFLQHTSASLTLKSLAGSRSGAEHLERGGSRCLVHQPQKKNAPLGSWKSAAYPRAGAHLDFRNAFQQCPGWKLCPYPDKTSA